MAGKRVKLIINPNADMGNAWRQATDLRAIAEEHGGADWAGTVYPTHATELARQAALDGYEVVIAVGGDGTAHEVINGLMAVPAEKRPKLGIVPMGSGNDFAHNLGVPDRPRDALKAALTGKTRKIDLALLEDEHGRKEYWDNTMNIGFGGSVNIYSHNLPVVRGFLMYFVATLLTVIRRYDVMKAKVKADGNSWEQDIIMFGVCNGEREGGGFITAPGAKFDDGLLNYTQVEKVSRLTMFRLIPEFLKGSQGKFKQVKMGTAKSLEIEAPESFTIHIDGETFSGFNSNVHKLKISILPQALEVLAPAA
jgi:YegS/Rv2252/BmrU family lipid kinase